MGRIFIILGKSATGKDTVYKHLLKQKELGLRKVVMYTTRPIRMSETEGEEYHFVEESRMAELMDEGRVIEHRSYDTVLGKWHYFTVNDGQIDIDKGSYLMHGTLESYGQIRKHFGKDRVVPIYIEVEDGIRLIRAIKREQKQEHPKYAEICRRFLADDADFSEENIKKFGITKRYRNMDINKCLKEIEDDVKKLTVN